MEFWKAITGAPVWVYVLFVYLMIVGIKSTKPRVISLMRLFIIPIILILISFSNLIAFKHNYFNIILWTVLFLIGVSLGWWQIRWLPIKVDKKHWLVRTPGGYSTLVLILIIFSIKYYFGYKTTVDPQIISNMYFLIAFLSISGFCIGFFIGRLSGYLFKMHRGLQVDLSQN